MEYKNTTYIKTKHIDNRVKMLAIIIKIILPWVIVLLLINTMTPIIIFNVKASFTISYVATTGNDTTGDGSFFNPYRTIQRAVNVSSAGDTVLIRGGNYNHAWKIGSSWYSLRITNSGTAGSPITVTNYGDERVVINGNGIDFSAGMSIVMLGAGYNGAGVGHIVFDGLIFENSSRHMIKTFYTASSPVHNITIKNCTFYNSSYGAVVFWEAYSGSKHQHADLTIENCSFSEIETIKSMGEAVTFFGCKNIRFIDNYMTNIYKIAVDICNNSKDAVIHRNIFNNTLQDANAYTIYIDGGQSHIHTATVSNITISNNLIYGTKNAIGLSSELLAGSINNITVVNNIINITGSETSYGITSTNYATHQYDITIMYNTIYKADGGGSAIRMRRNGTFYHRYVIANNIFVTGGTTNYQIHCENLDSTDKNVTRANNLYYHTGKASNTFFKDGTAKFEDSAICEAPQFVSIATYDFHLKNNSPAINSASNNYTIGFDYDTNTRPQGAGYDIGSYELCGDDVIDLIAPMIFNVNIITSNPIDTEPGIGWENFTCNVTDNIGVSFVILNLTYPNQSTVNIPMLKKADSAIYYSNQSLNQPGNYSYNIIAIDSNDNIGISGNYYFLLPPNWDVNCDGLVTVIDFVLISNQYGQTGNPGWIREDIDNNGIIDIIDMVIMSNHFGEVWFM